MNTITLIIADNPDDSVNEAQKEIIKEVIEELTCSDCGKSPKFLSETQVSVCEHENLKEQIKRVHNVIVAD